MLTVACVWVGTKYGPEYVVNLESMVRRHLEAPFRFVCLTDHPEVPAGTRIGVERYGLEGWWNKMLLFDPTIRGDGRCLYFDLDTVIVGDLEPLAKVPATFGICRNFTRAVKPDYPCRYGSCVMSLGEGFCGFVTDEFLRRRDELIARCPYGDQQAIEMLVPDATYLQDVTPAGYFVGRRDFTNRKPDGATVMIFAGKAKPHDTPIKWLREAWG